MNPRDYQQLVIDRLWEYYQDNDGNPIIVMPTGTGKSLIIAYILKTVASYNKKAIALTHVKELIKQNSKCYLKYTSKKHVSIYSAGLGKKQIGKITFAGIASVYKKAKNFGNVACIIIDECHLVSPKDEAMYNTFIKGLKKINPNLKIIGLTATPFRTKEGYLHEGPIFTDLAVDLTTKYWFQKLIQDGYLGRLVVKHTANEYDVEKVKIQGNEFVQSDLQLTVNKQDKTHKIIREVLKNDADRKHWLVFASGIQHAENVKKALIKFGVNTDCVHSKMTKKKRDSVINKFRKGKLTAIVNSNILIAGFDYPEIDLIIVMRPTLSPVFWVQMLGRGTRVFPKKENCLVLDFAGNTKRLGPIDNVYLPFLKKRRGKLSKHRAPVKACPKCKTYCHARVRACPECNYLFPEMDKLTIKASKLTVMGEDQDKKKVLYKVDSLVYTKHLTSKRINTLLIVYKCKSTYIKHWVCVEHTGFARLMAIRWFNKHIKKKVATEAIPNTVDKLFLSITSNQIKKPTHIIVDQSGKYKQVIDWRFE